MLRVTLSGVLVLVLGEGEGVLSCFVQWRKGDATTSKYFAGFSGGFGCGGDLGGDLTEVILIEAFNIT